MAIAMAVMAIAITVAIAITISLPFLSPQHNKKAHFLLTNTLIINCKLQNLEELRISELEHTDLNRCRIIHFGVGCWSNLSSTFYIRGDMESGQNLEVTGEMGM